METIRVGREKGESWPVDGTNVRVPYLHERWKERVTIGILKQMFVVVYFKRRKHFVSLLPIKI